MRPGSQPTDEDLLTSGTPAAFGLFYERRVREVLGFMMRRTGDPEVAADLTAETFAAAIVARRRFRPGGAPAGAWLFTIAHRRLVDYQRRGYADERARRRLGLERRVPGEEDSALIRILGEEVTIDWLDELPPVQRAAIEAHVLEERPYSDIAGELGTSEAAVRMRVSRGLASLRGRLRSAR
jgi:RNA polymerase sigma factor (sigma-70 family)